MALTSKFDIDLNQSKKIEYPCLRIGDVTGSIYLYTDATADPIVVALGHSPYKGTYVGKVVSAQVLSTSPFFGSVTISTN